MSKDHLTEPPDHSAEDRAYAGAEAEWDAMTDIERAEALAEGEGEDLLSWFVRWVRTSEEMTAKDDETKEARQNALYCVTRFLDQHPARERWIDYRAEQLQEETP